MLVPLFLLVVLIALAPAYLTIESIVATGLVCAAVATALFITAVTLRVDGIRKLGRALSPALLIILLAPLLWMLLQIAPIPLNWFSDPVWTSTSAALNLPISGSISIDTGATLLSIANYCAVFGTAIVAAALTSDRQSAGNMLDLLTATITLIAGAEIARKVGHLWFAHSADGDFGSAFLSVMGIIVCCSQLIRIRHQLSRTKASGALPARVMITLAGTAVGLLLCTVSLLIRNDVTALFAALLAAGVPISMFAIRRWSLRTWGRLGLLATALMILVAFLAVAPIKPDADPALALSQYYSPTAELMLVDVPPLGRGAGSVGDILPVYRDIKQPLSNRNVTTAAAMAVEMGRGFLWLFVFALAAGATFLIRASLSRGRDYVYAANGAGILLAISFMTFADSDVLNLLPSLVASTALGLAWAQAGSHSEASSVPEPSRQVLRGQLSCPTVRLVCALFGLLLTAGSCWILIPEYYAGGLPAARAGMAASTVENEDLHWAATLAVVRGDLWAKSALSILPLMEGNPAASSVADRVRQRLVNALKDAPYQADIWLTLADLAYKFKWARYDMPTLLKMVYYTGANDIQLMPRRTRLALRLDATASDIELRDLVERDVELILRRRPELRPALVEAYRSASPEGRALADRVIARADPAFLKVVQGQ